MPGPSSLASMTQSDADPQRGVNAPTGPRGGERMAASRDGQQLLVQDRPWNPRRIAGRTPVGIAIDMGAGGGN